MHFIRTLVVLKQKFDCPPAIHTSPMATPPNSILSPVAADAIVIDVSSTASMG